MHPLVFLALKSFKNGIRRAFSSGRRIISLLFIVGYYFWLIARPFLMPSPRMASLPGQPSITFQMPPMSYVEGVVFWVFAGLNFLLMLAPIKITPKQADVDVLYATPVDPRHVLLFRLMRDYASTLFVPLFLALIGLGTARQLILPTLLKGIPQTSGITIRMAIITWLFLSAMWVCVHSAIGLWTNRTDPDSRFNNRKVLIAFWAVTLPVFLLGYFQAREIHDWPGLVSFAANSVYRVYFFGATLASKVIVGSLESSWLSVAGGLALIALIGAAGMWAAFRQIGYLYDQSTIHSESRNRMKDLMRKGDVFAVSANRAAEGKLKAKSNRLTRLVIPGPFALIWKDLVIQLRSNSILVPIGVISVMFVFVLFTVRNIGIAGPMTMAICGLATFMITMGSAQVQAIETLRRVDIHKPMPFSPMTMILMEILGAAIVPGLTSCIPAFLAGVLSPADWAWSVSALVAVPTMSLLICSAVFLVFLLFPDYEDPTQRGFRGLMTLLGIAIAAAPGVGLMIAAAALNVPLLGAFLWAIMNVVLALAAAFLGGRLYMNFNATE